MKKVIRLTESDLENIIRRVVSEQASKTSELKLPDYGKYFQIGKYEDVDGSIKDVIEKDKSKVIEFMKGLDQSSFIAQINASESNIRNPKGFETKGSLALARAQTVAKILQEVYADLISKRILEIKVPSLEEVGKGTTAYKREDFARFCGVNKEKMNTRECQNYLEPYNKEQFVSLTIKGSGVKSIPCEDPIEIRGQKMSAPDFKFMYKEPLTLPTGITSLEFNAFTIPDRPIFIFANGTPIIPPYFVRETASLDRGFEFKYYAGLAILKFLYPESEAFQGVETMDLTEPNNVVGSYWASRVTNDGFMNNFVNLAKSYGGVKNSDIAGIINRSLIKKQVQGKMQTRYSFKENDSETNQILTSILQNAPKVILRDSLPVRVTKEMGNKVTVGAYAPLDKTVFAIKAACKTS
jgi:hypothetical protein